MVSKIMVFILDTVPLGCLIMSCMLWAWSKSITKLGIMRMGRVSGGVMCLRSTAYQTGSPLEGTTFHTTIMF